ncbi:MAG: glycosyltransferase family 4 protein [Patescibacteria group bacterium]
MLKIGIVCPYDIFAGGGVQEQVLALNKIYNESGIKSVIITPRPAGCKDDYDDIIFLGKSRPFKSMHTQSQFSVSIDTDKIDQVLAAEDFDILHFHEPWVPVMSRQVLSRSTSINFATFHAAIPDLFMAKTIERVFKPYTKSILKYLDVLTAVSPTATNSAVSITNRKILVIPNGIDVKQFSRSELTVDHSSRIRIFYVGRLEKRKGLRYLIEAFADLRAKRDDVELIIAGTGPDTDKLKDKVKEDKIPDVTFVGRITDQEKIDYLHTSHIFCSPALYGESFGIVLLEAMASGAVAVAGNNSGYKDVMSGDGRMSIINPKEVEEFSRRLELLIDSKNLRTVWQSWAKAEVEKYDFSTVARSYINLYKMAHEKKNGNKE